jgi:uncharacterized membrane protein
MHFASFPPAWLAVIAVAAIAGVAWLAYRRPLAPLSSAQRSTLVALRTAALLLILLFLFRPIVLRPPAATGDIVVPVLVDASRSMAIQDADGKTRLARAVDALSTAVLPGVAAHFTPEIYRVGNGIAPAPLTGLLADANQSDLIGAVRAIRDRYRGRRVAGIVLISDGGDTEPGATLGAESSAPVFTIGVGSASGIPDREVVGIAAGDPRLDEASVDLHVTVVSRGFGRAPFDVRLSADGRTVDTRHVTPVVDGAPVEEVFTVSPDAASASVYTAEIPAGPGEQITGNNARSVLVSPHGRKRRVLVVEGAPGFEHSFLTRALAADPDLEIDSIVRKGKNDQGQDTFFVQAAASRAPLLTSGFPARREDLFSYDAVVVANIGGDFFTRAQLASLADFVSVRGGGLLVLGGLSFAGHSFIGTPIEPVLPVELSDRRGGLARSSLGVDLDGPRDAVVLTPQGESHPVMRIGTSVEDTRKKWAAMPPLASTAPLGGPRAGATVLAVTTAPGGAVYPVVAVQQYGGGRSMIFGGEASWRWKMMMPHADRSYEFFWRQAVRWLAGPSPDQVELSVPGSAQPGDSVSVRATVRDAAFLPVPDATIAATATTPGGASQPLTFRKDDSSSGGFSAAFNPSDKGVYHVQADAARGATRLGSAERWFYVGGSDRELADPRLNEGVLRRIARASGGRYVPVADASRVVSWLGAQSVGRGSPEPHDLWQEPWMFGIAVALLSLEWILRRRWGLR